MKALFPSCSYIGLRSLFLGVGAIDGLYKLFIGVFRGVLPPRLGGVIVIFTICLMRS